MSLFNGSDLGGWQGDTNLWHVTDGAIMAVTAEEGIRRRHNTSLIWRGVVDDFELRLRFRQVDVSAEKPANSGVFYRARHLGDWLVYGYQADLFSTNTGSLVLVEGKPTDYWVERGRSAVLRTVNGKLSCTNTMVITEPARLRNLLQKGGWNELVVVAQGHRLIHRINGVVTADVIDERTAERRSNGCLALELKRATTVQFRDIRLKRLPVAAK